MLETGGWPPWRASQELFRGLVNPDTRSCRDAVPIAETQATGPCACCLIRP